MISVFIGLALTALGAIWAIFRSLHVPKIGSGENFRLYLWSTFKIPLAIEILGIVFVLVGLSLVS